MTATNENRQPAWAIRPLVPEEVYTDRQEYLDYLYKAALNAIRRRTMSTVLLGQRRMGKGERRASFVESVIRFETALFREDRLPARVIAATLIMANKMIDKERLKALWEDVKMLDIVEIAREKGLEEGRRLGGIEAAREMLPNLVLEKFGIVPGGIQEEVGEIKSLFTVKSLLRRVRNVSRPSGEASGLS